MTVPRYGTLARALAQALVLALAAGLGGGPARAARPTAAGGGATAAVVGPAAHSLQWVPVKADAQGGDCTKSCAAGGMFPAVVSSSGLLCAWQQLQVPTYTSAYDSGEAPASGAPYSPRPCPARMACRRTRQMGRRRTGWKRARLPPIPAMPAAAPCARHAARRQGLLLF